MNKRRETASIPEDAPSSQKGDVEQDAPREETDHELVQSCKDGNPQAFHGLFVRYHRRAFRVAFGVVHNKDDALDVVQDAFFKAHRHIKNFEGTASFYTWLYRIVMNVAIDHIRKKSRSAQVDYDDAVAHLEEDAPVGMESLQPQILRGDPVKELKRQEIRGQIAAALDKLSPKHRAVLVMRELEGMSYEEMAKAMKCSKGTIMSRLFHARRYMQKYLLELMGEHKDSGT